MDLDSGDEPSRGVDGNMHVDLVVQRTIKRAAICALSMTLCTVIGQAEIFSESRGVVQAPSKGVTNCSAAGHTDAGVWLRVW